MCEMTPAGRACCFKEKPAVADPNGVKMRSPGTQHRGWCSWAKWMLGQVYAMDMLIVEPFRHPLTRFVAMSTQVVA